MMRNKLFVLLFLCACSGTHDYIGEEYLNKPYVPNPLGEEKSPDNDPLIRFDAFDCTTFVETALANGDVKKLNQIRYKNGKIDFLNRNHFVETDWLKNNDLENVSRFYAPVSIRRVTIDKKSWLKKLYGIDADFGKQTVDIEYISYKNLSKIDIQTPLIVLFIHDGNGFDKKIGTDLSVVHMGFLLPGNVLRHASRKRGYVLDTDFDAYVNKRKENKHNLGIALVKIK